MIMLTEQEKIRYYLNLEKVRHKHDALFLNELRRFFAEELILLLALPEFTKEKIFQTLDAREQRLRFLLAPLYQNCSLEFYSLELSIKSLDNVFKVSQETIALRCKHIIASTKRYIDQAFSSKEMVRDKIRNLYSTNGRPYRIARTEVTTASNLGMYEAALSSGKQYKFWICSREDSVRHGHRILEREKLPIKEFYSNGLLFPGDPKAEPNQVINCRCFQIFV